MLKQPAVPFYFLYLLSVLSGAGGFLIPGKVPELIPFLLYSLIRAFYRTKGEFPFLVLSAGFAVLGLLQGAVPPLMYLYMGLSLACFDIIRMEKRISGCEETKELHRYRILRLSSLAGVMAAAFVIILLLRTFSLTLPFLMLLIPGVAGFVALNRIIHILREGKV